MGHFAALLEFACHVVHSFTEGVLESSQPNDCQLTSDNAGNSPLSQDENEWDSHAFDDEFIYQEYSNCPDRECHGSETIGGITICISDAAQPPAIDDDESDEDEGRPMGWKEQRPTFTRGLKRAFAWGSVLSLITAVGIGLLCMLYSYVSLQTSDRCWFLQWKDIPYKVQWYIQACVYIKICLHHFSYLASIMLIFKRYQIDGLRLKLFYVTLFFTALDILSKVVLQVTKSLRKLPIFWLPGNVCLFATLFIQGYILSGRFRRNARGKVTLAVKFALPWALASCAKYAFVYGIYPRYRTTNDNEKFLIAMFSPLCTVILKVVSRFCVQRLWGINHAGTTFIFLAPLYCTSALFTRMLQVELGILEKIAIIAVIHGVVEVIERSTIVVIDHIHNQIIERRLAPCGTFRSPRSERLNADIVILSMLQESISIVAVNGFVFVFHMVYSSPDKFPELIKSWLITTMVQLVIEWFFTSVSLSIETHFQNMPVIKIWRAKWHLHTAVSLILATAIFFSSTGYFYVELDIDWTNFSMQEKCDLP